jgi:hypothetical protein
MGDHEREILANLNILQGEEPIYQMKQLKTDLEEPKTFFTSLPQTQEELE